MTSKSDQYNLDALTRFKTRNKFSDKAWRERGLNPSSYEMSRFLNDFFSSCTNEIIEAISNEASKKELQKILKANLSSLNKMDYDTEEREFICDLFDELSKTININFGSDLNKWLYGYLLTALSKIQNIFQSAKVVYTLTEPCDFCGTELETNILKTAPEVPETDWLVVKCNVCNTINLITIGAGVKELKFGNYQWIENIKLEQYSYEQALARVEQLNSNKS